MFSPIPSVITDTGSSVVDLGQQPQAAVGQPVDEIGLPQGPRAVERAGEDARHLLGQLLVARRRRQRELAHVVLEIEVRVVDPVGVVEPERDRLQPPAERRQQGQALGDEGEDIAELERSGGTCGGIEDGQAADVTGLARILESEELRVEAGELAHGRQPT
jgi:hypothetical protein